MFDFSDAKLTLTINDIYQKVTSYDIFKRYCTNFEELNKPFLSEFYNDTKPSCNIFYNGKGDLYYKDFGTGDHLNCIAYVQKKFFNCTIQEALRIIANDFNILKIQLNIDPKLVLTNDVPSIPNTIFNGFKSKLEPIKQPFNSVDYTFWSSYKIDLEDLVNEEVFSCKYVYLYTKKGTYIYESSKTNPIYAWPEYDINLTFIGYKVYMPYNTKQKWLNTGSQKVIQCIKTLSKEGNLLIITKSKKDCIILKKLGYNTISLSSESTFLSQEYYDILKSRFKELILLYDNDEAGKNYSKLIADKYNIKQIFVSRAKDISDYTKKYSLMSAKLMINKKLKEL